MLQRAPDSPEVPSDRYERRARRRGARLVAGVDEAGRGPLAGPVVVAAVIFPDRRYPDGLNDSKKLTAAQRERLYEVILERASVSIAVASRARIDRMNILRASLWAMSRAVAGPARAGPITFWSTATWSRRGLPAPRRRSSAATACRSPSPLPRSSPR